MNIKSFQMKCVLNGWSLESLCSAARLAELRLFSLEERRS